MQPMASEASIFRLMARRRASVRDRFLPGSDRPGRSGRGVVRPPRAVVRRDVRAGGAASVGDGAGLQDLLYPGFVPGMCANGYDHAAGVEALLVVGRDILGNAERREP